MAVIGAGYSGVEVATSVAEYIGKDRALVSIVDRNECVMHTSSPHNRRAAERYFLFIISLLIRIRSLLNFGVSLQLNASVQEVLPDGVMIQIEQGAPFKIDSDLVILTCGIQPSELVGSLPFGKDKSGRLLVSRTLQTVTDPNVFAIGDCASIQGEAVPLTAQAAMQQSDIVVRNLEALNNAESSPSATSLEKFRYIPLGEMLTLGGTVTDGSLSSLGGLIELDGPLAGLARRAVYAARMPTPQQSLTAAVSAGVVSLASLLLKASPDRDRRRV